MLEQVYGDMQYLQSVCRASSQFVTLLRSPIIKGDKKQSIILAVMGNQVGELTKAFTKLLTTKGREMYLPEITDEFIAQYKKYKGIYSIRLTTAKPVSQELCNAIVDKVKAETEMKNIELETAEDPALIGGFTLQMGDKLVDASIAYDLNKIRSQFMRNDFIYKIR